VQARDLPIYELEREIVRSLGAQPRLILQAPTGSGKSTQVPQMLLDHGLLGDREVVILQPRRLAARLLASRVAHERNGRLGDEVGYQIRFENVVSRRTRIRFVTEGILLRQLIQDPELRGVAAILFDEFTSDISTATSHWRARSACRRQRGPTSRSSSCRQHSTPARSTNSSRLLRC
jgi:ATP-dependent helicase HrpB